MSGSFSGQRLEQLRGRKTQTDLANGLRARGFGTTQTTVSRWESGQVPHSSVLPALAAELGVSVQDLFEEPDDAEAATMRAAVPHPSRRKVDLLEVLRDALADACERAQRERDEAAA